MKRFGSAKVWCALVAIALFVASSSVGIGAPVFSTAVSSVAAEVHTPMGTVPSGCVHPIGSGIASIVNLPGSRELVTYSNGDTAIYRSCVKQMSTLTWDETAYADVSPIKALAANFTVPTAPKTQSDQIIYMFPATQNCFSNCGNFVLIIQPVLQWGDNGAFGGNYYVVASWYVDSNGVVYYSTPIKVSSGNTLVGTLTASKCNSQYTCNWTITGKDATKNTKTVLKSHGAIIEQQVAFITLEQYSVTECSEYPASGHTTFSGITVNGKTLSKSDWTAYNWVSGCGLKVVVNSGSSVTLDY